MALIDKETIYAEIEARREHMVYELYGLEENTPEYQRVKGMHDAYVDMLTYLTYSLPEQPASEDERTRKAIGAAICGATAKSILEANGTNLPDALAYLEKQKEHVPENGKMGTRTEQKPAEWSEEEMKYINTCLLILNRPFHDMSDGERAAYNWLKSLRPSWKPSEEQMEALKKVACNLVGTGTETDVYLVQLYEQLKAL